MWIEIKKKRQAGNFVLSRPARALWIEIKP